MNAHSVAIVDCHVHFVDVLEFLHFSCDGGLGETAIADLDVEMFDQFGMIDHFFSQQRD